MGRDFTPREMYLCEQHDIAKGRGSLWDFMGSLTWSYNGKTWPYRTREQIECRKQFPSLGRFYDDFERLYERLSDLPCGTEVLRSKDEELTAYIESGTQDGVSDVAKWFEGRLAECFHYNTENNRLLFEVIWAEALRLSLETAIAFEYKGLVFDDWTVDQETGGIWGEMCQDCANKYMDVLCDELNEGGMGACSLQGCSNVGADMESDTHYYVDFDPALIRPIFSHEICLNEGVKNSERDVADVEEQIRRAEEVGSMMVASTTVPVNMEKLQKYLAEEMIIEFESAEECMQYFNTYDGQEFKTVDEMKAYQIHYGFGIGEKWYHISYDEALDVLEMPEHSTDRDR